MGDEIVEMPIVYGTAPTVAPQQCGREPDAYEVRCTDGNYEWRRPYHGELEVIMRTGRDRSGKPFEYRALFADAPAGRGATPAEVAGLVGRLQERATVMEALSPDFASACREAASLIQSQAARIAELEEEAEHYKEIGSLAVKFRFSDDIFVESRGPGVWVVTNGSSVLNNLGEWEYEPRPSSRTDEFIDRTRLAFSDAVIAARSILNGERKG